MAIRSYIHDGRKLFEVYVQGSDRQGRRIQRKRRGIESQRKADLVEFELKRELAQIREQAVPFRWGEWFNECMKRMRAEYQPSTLMNYEGQLGKWVHPRWWDLEISQITKNHVYNLIFDELTANQVSAQTRKSILKMVKRLFQMACDDGFIDRNPCTGVTVKVAEVEQKVLTNTEVETLLREAKLTRHRFFPIWFIALKTGMRSGEMMALQWSDIDFDARIISVSKQWTSKAGFTPTKTRRSRVVPISEDLLQFLKELKLKRSGESEFVLPRLPEWETGMQAQVTREFCDAIGVTSVKFHDLRATFITNLLSRGVPLAQVMAVVGHHQLKTTNGYLRKAGVEVKGVTDQLGYQVRLPEGGAKVLSLIGRRRDDE